MTPIKQKLLNAIDQAPDSLLEQLLQLLQTLSSTPKSRAPFGAMKTAAPFLATSFPRSFP
ncbi:MAG: hypothetical protein HC857_16115 [Synechococcales cyanobacterium RU_4_20]|nr:hypothetical protein [Synechococcales cyanobacterium RU_4_20]